jgi:hypothetical protein
MGIPRLESDVRNGRFTERDSRDEHDWGERIHRSLLQVLFEDTIDAILPTFRGFKVNNEIGLALM